MGTEECLKCAKCKNPLSGKKFFKDSNSDFICEDCKPSINCSTCKKKFGNGEPFYKGDNDDIKYCVDCFNKNIGGNNNGASSSSSSSSSSGGNGNGGRGSNDSIICNSCSQPITDKVLSFEGANFHMNCFKCIKCSKSLNGQPFFKDPSGGLTCDNCRQGPSCSSCKKKFGNGEPFYKGESDDIKYCSTCINSKMKQQPARQCSNCLQQIGPNETSLVFDNKAFHAQCFKCSSCLQLIDASIKFYKDSKGSIICANCSF